MPTLFTDLRAFITVLEEKKVLRKVLVPVNPALEIAAITQQVGMPGGSGSALLFESPQGSPWRLTTNLFGSAERAALAWGTPEIRGLEETLLRDLAAAGPGSGLDRMLRVLQRAAAQPRLGGEPSWRAAKDVDLFRLPALTAWPGDGGPYLTLAVVVTRHPASSRVNYGLYRLQVLGPQRAVIHWNPGAGGAEHHRAWAASGEAMPVAVVLGGPPALLAAASMPLPAEVDEAEFVGYLCGEALECAPGPLTGLPLPVGAEFVLEGSISAEERAMEGPFGNFTGRYVPPSMQPVFAAQALYHRPEPILPATVVGPPPMEDCYLAQVNSRLLFALWACDHPQMLDLHCPLAGIFHGAALVSVAAGTGTDLIQRLWQAPQFRRARLLVACPPEIDIHNPGAVYWHALNVFDPQRDLLVQGERLGLDLSRVPAGAPVEADAATSALLQTRWKEYFPDEF